MKFTKLTALNVPTNQKYFNNPQNNLIQLNLLSNIKKITVVVYCFFLFSSSVSGQAQGDSWWGGWGQAQGWIDAVKEKVFIIFVNKQRKCLFFQFI